VSLLSRSAGPEPASPPSRLLLELALRHDRIIVIAGLGLVTFVSWWWILALSSDMYGSMTGASAWAMTAAWDVRHMLLLVGMWTVMMVAMMLPSATPMIMLYMAVIRRNHPGAVAKNAYALVGGYLLVWMAFSVAAAVGQRLLTSHAIVSAMMSLTDTRVGAAVLLAVAVYQFTPIKRDCLDACRSPLMLITTYWRPGMSGAFTMGLRHGVFCLGCCWALMLLLFAGGVMNMWVIGGLTLFVLVEKTTPIGRTASYLGGLVLAAIGLWLLIR
jgi:predicted metal-binding membrane protein